MKEYFFMNGFSAEKLTQLVAAKVQDGWQLLGAAMPTGTGYLSVTLQRDVVKH